MALSDVMTDLFLAGFSVVKISKESWDAYQLLPSTLQVDIEAVSPVFMEKQAQVCVEYQG